MSFLKQLKDGKPRGDSKVVYRYNKHELVYERADVGYDNWTEFCILYIKVKGTVDESTKLTL